VNKFIIPFQHLPRETDKNLKEDSQPLDMELNLGPHKYEERVLITTTQN